jgi:hypothetical protein
VPTAGTTRSAVLGATSARDVDIKFRVRADKVAAGGAYYIYAAVRIIGTSEYRPRFCSTPTARSQPRRAWCSTTANRRSAHLWSCPA